MSNNLAIDFRKKRKSNQSNQALKVHLQQAATVRNVFSMEGFLDLQERPSPLCSRTGDGSGRRRRAWHYS